MVSVRELGFYGTKIDFRSKSGRTLMLVMTVLGLIMIAVGASSVLRTERELDALTRTDAVIVALDTKGPRPHKTTVEYEANGERYTATLENYYFTYKVGRRLPVAYDPEDPAAVQLAGFGRLLQEGLLGIIGLCFAVGGIVALTSFKSATLDKEQEE